MLSSNALFIWPGEQFNSFHTLNYSYVKVQLFKNHMQVFIHFYILIIIISDVKFHLLFSTLAH